MSKSNTVELPWKWYLIPGIFFCTIIAIVLVKMYQQNIYLMFAFAFLIFLSMSGLIIPATTKFSEHTIKQLTYKGWIECNWDEIDRVEKSMLSYHLFSNTNKFIVAPMLYNNHKQIDKLMENKLRNAKWVYS